jgi:hypothetical protein
MQVERFPVFLPVQSKQVHEELLDTLARGFRYVNEDAVVRLADHDRTGTGFLTGMVRVILRRVHELLKISFGRL